MIDTEFAFNRYQQVSARLPTHQFTGTSQFIENITDISESFDVFLFDAFGVLNVGESAIEGAVDKISGLMRRNKQIFVVTNASSVSIDKLIEKYHRFGFGFNRNQVISSRQLLVRSLQKYSSIDYWGIMASQFSDIKSLPVKGDLLTHAAPPSDQHHGFILLGTADWDDELQRLLIQALSDNPRPVLIGNPDIVAPRGDCLSLEPGYYAHEIIDKAEVKAEFFGKPFANVFDEVKRRIQQFDSNRVLMVGDTLHTDILGGAAAGFATALVTDHGLFKDHNVHAYMERSGIIADYYLPSI